MTTTEACEEIRNKLQDTLLKGLGKAEDYGLFCPDKDDSKKGFWLDPARTLEYYQFENRVDCCVKVLTFSFLAILEVLRSQLLTTGNLLKYFIQKPIPYKFFQRMFISEFIFN